MGYDGCRNSWGVHPEQQCWWIQRIDYAFFAFVFAGCFEFCRRLEVISERTGGSIRWATAKNGLWVIRGLSRGVGSTIGSTDFLCCHYCLAHDSIAYFSQLWVRAWEDWFVRTYLWISLSLINIYRSLRSINLSEPLFTGIYQIFCLIGWYFGGFLLIGAECQFKIW